jgi:chemotaxis protein methyltransferase CheR
MSVLDALEYPETWDIMILASDISLRVLDCAQKGVYSENEIDTVHPEYQKEFFDKVNSHYQIKQNVKKLVVFDFHNLKHENGLTGLDVIFCRNVMIYFDRDEQKRLVDKFHNSLSDGGYLFLGHSESLQGLSDKFKFMYHNKGAVYKKVP